MRTPAAKQPEMTTQIAKQMAGPRPFMIGVAGGSAAGKKEVCEMILYELQLVNKHCLKCVHIRIEDFYKELNVMETALKEENEYNFDHPDAFDFDLLSLALEDISSGRSTAIPVYDFLTCARKPDPVQIVAPDVVIVSGILTLYQHRIRELFDLKVFIDVDADTRLSRTVLRDTASQQLDRVLHYYSKFVKPSFDDFVYPTKKYSDITIPRGEDNVVAIELLTEHIAELINKK